MQCHVRAAVRSRARRVCVCFCRGCKDDFNVLSRQAAISLSENGDVTVVGERVHVTPHTNVPTQ